MEKRAKQIKIPVDIRRIPYKIATGEGFLDYTANHDLCDTNYVGSFG